MKSRRDFLKLVAAGSAAATLGRAGRVAAATAKAADAASTSHAHTGTASHGAPRSAALESELGKQKKSTADTLKTVRAHELASGTPLAFVFKPMTKNGHGGHAS